MARGFLSGIAMGVVVSAAGLSGLSVMTMPPSGGVTGAADDIEVSTLPNGAGDEGSLDVGEVDTPSDDSADPQEDTPQMAAPTDDARTDDAQADPAPLGETDPQENVPPSAEAETLDSPSDDAPSSIVVDSASDPTSDQGMVEPADAPIVETPNVVVPDAAPDQPAVPTEDMPAATPLSEGAEADLSSDAPPPPAMDEKAPDASPAPETDAPKDITLPDVAPMPSAENTPPAIDAADGQDIAEPDVAPKAGTPSEGAGVKSAPVAPIGDLAPNVETNRLPSISDEAPQAEVEAETTATKTEQSPLAIVRNATDYDRVADLPVMALMLKDEGGARATLGDLSTLPFPVTFVVDATAADAAEAVAFYRAQGAEVVVEVALPPASTPADAEVNFQVQAPIVDQGVAVLMNDISGFQEDADLAKQVAQILVASGHGVVSFPKGLSTGNRLAIKAGVPAGTVFRDLDGAGQDGRTIRRFLDNAAFKARQTERVILFGRARPETVQALIEWSLGNRAKSVSVAPVSAVLLGE